MSNPLEPNHAAEGVTSSKLTLLARPHGPLIAAFTEVLDEIDYSDVRALLIQAEGDHFGGGVNVNTTFVGVESKNARRLLNRGIPMVTRLEGLNIPVVCAVQGLCLAAALSGRCVAT